MELRGLYELATALVFPSRFEGWGLPVCEAFSAGLPVASSSATGLPDLVGDAGLIFDPESTRADRRCRASGSGPTRSSGATSPHAVGSAASSSAGSARRACFALTTAGSAGGALQRKTVSFWRPRLPPERRPFPTWTPDLPTSAPSPRSSARSSACSPRCGGSSAASTRSSSATGCRHIDRQTERLGSASVEAVTHLGGEVRALEAAARGDRAGARRAARAARAAGALVRRGRRAGRGAPARRLTWGSIRGPSGSMPGGRRALVMPSARAVPAKWEFGRLWLDPDSERWDECSTWPRRSGTGSTS